MDLSSVVVNWNSGPFLARLLRSLDPLRRELAEVIVVDNASQDDSLDAALNVPGVRLFRQERNLGFAAAANLGIERAPSSFILLLNPDVEVSEESVTGLYGEIIRRLGAAVVCGALRGPAGELQTGFQIRPLPSLFRVLAEVLFLDELVRPFVRPRQWPREGPVPVEQPAAAAWLMRKSAWSELGGFDERFQPAWFEDVDFCRRLKKENWEILFYPEWELVHRGGISLESMSYPEFLDCYYGNLLLYWRKHHPRSLPLVHAAVRVGVAIRRQWGRR